MTEAIVSGVPNMFDQPTNVVFIEEEWGVGIKAERDGDGVLMGAELARCVEVVMCEGAKAMAIREKAKGLKEVAQAAAGVGGSAERNLHDFVRAIPCRNQ
ncbi:cyanidin 3-O-rutinoside 5-O-glucosyltransferase-like [Panicum miliaceum]|uniref:Cyanidin 3-O-rutinoside 5-O-glucosyltransferase-like n=1 Tax=Panicum miliaceum TaxID=4540 RepID=A0A3L6Q3D5_PANMI|nr:cyanidin 3-O-rutinoside 5-O-glucosyltransferase-like [Panicum miliaceum]